MVHFRAEFKYFQKAGTEWNGLEWNGMFSNKINCWVQNVKWDILDEDGMVWNRMVGMVRVGPVAEALG